MVSKRFDQIGPDRTEASEQVEVAGEKTAHTSTTGSSSLWEVNCVDAREGMKALASHSADLVLTDPIYPEVNRAYGRISVPSWKWLMHDVIKETRRVLKPSGSAIFILQPNAEHVGRMRPWFFEFLAWIAKTWNLVQDVWWWNPAAMPTVHSNRSYGLLRPSVKACVWMGEPDCYKNQDAVLWSPSVAARTAERVDRALITFPSGHHLRRESIARAMSERGGVTPFNLIPLPNTNSTHSAGAKGHGAGTPKELCLWWTRYLTRGGDLVVDPFCGSGTVGEAALTLGRRFVGFDCDRKSVELAQATCHAINPK